MKSLTNSGVAVGGAYTITHFISAGSDASHHATMCSGPFRSMVRSKLNVRRKSSDTGELKSIIRAQGLLQNLVGFKQIIDGVETGIIEIVAGGRRLAAVGELIAEGDLPEDFGIPFMLVTEQEAVEISLAENSGREEMHPADVFDAMMELSKRGRSLDDIALLFGLDVLTVKRRLKLANVSPRLLDLYRNEKASFDQMQALAISDDQQAQEQAWDSLPAHGRYPNALRRLLTAQLLNVRTDRLVQYVGIDAFEQAGGIITRDLFSGSGDGYVADIALLEKLAFAKFEKQRKRLLKEGFAWVDILPRADYAELAEYTKVRTETAPLTVEQAERASKVDGEILALEGKLDVLEEGGDEEGASALSGALNALRRSRRELDAERITTQKPEDKALAGAIITLDDQGRLVIRRDQIRPGDKSKMMALAGESQSRSRKCRAVHSERLTHELTSQRTLALQAEMMEQSDIALVYLTYTLMRKVLADFPENTLALVNVSRPMLAETAKSSAAAVAVAQRREQLVAQLPDDRIGGGWLEWLANSPTSTVLDVLAYCVASTIDATQRHESDSPMFVTLAQGLKLDMSKWWQPTPENYFNHVTKERIINVVTESPSTEAAVPLNTMKKGLAAEAAGRILADSNWLPEVLRV